ncbi:MAG: hypothetical protein WBQ94_07620, partial [Terracidiphilus sp.]
MALAWFALVTAAAALAQGVTAGPIDLRTSKTTQSAPPRVIQAQKFLADRGWTAGRAPVRSGFRPSARRGDAALIEPVSASALTSTATWQPLGPTAVLTPN